MATPLKITKEAQAHVVAYAQKILTAHRQFSELHNKMEVIDQAYARYKATGQDQEVCADIFEKDNIVPPIVVSQVDSMIAYWADVFLSGYPLFPVVSTPAKRKWAEQLEALLDDHANLGGYARQLLLFLTDAAKYNFAAVEGAWDSISEFSVLDDYREESRQKVETEEKSFTRVTRWDPYNTVWDYNVTPANVAEHGDYAGHIQLLSRVKFKRLLNKYTASREVYNAREAEEINAPSGQGSVAYSSYFKESPEVSHYVTARKPLDQIDWEGYMATGQTTGRRSNRRAGKADNYEVFRFYARIIPADFGIDAPKPNTPQIWHFVIVNNQILVHAKRIISARDFLPVLFGQPKEDGLGVQTQSIAEGVIDFQEAAHTLYNIRFNAARRAVSDRALYDADIIRPKDVNSKAAAPKIPVNLKSISGKTIRDAYLPIPFDMRGTESTLQDAVTINEFSKELTGLNAPQRGQFQKGNKSVTEWNDTMGNSDNRLRLSALLLEHQVFMPLKMSLKLNVFQYGDNVIVVSQKTGEVIEVDIAELRKHTMSFQIADGYSPKSKLASAEMLQMGFQLIQGSEMLQQAYGQHLPAMFAHMMQLGGVRGLDEYSPELQAQAEQQQGPAGLERAPLGGQLGPESGGAPLALEGQGLQPSPEEQAMMQQMAGQQGGLL